MTRRATPPDTSEIAAALREKLDISASYASELARGKRQPSLVMALRIYEELGIKLGLLAHATPAEIRVLGRVVAKERAAAEFDPAEGAAA